MSALSDSNSLYISLTSPLISNSSLDFLALVDSGSIHCFMDNRFTSKYSLLMSPIRSIELKLFDGSSNSFISEVTTIPITFPTGECIPVDFYITPLNSSVSVVLGYNWLICYNPSIDWILRNIIFRSTVSDVLSPPPMSSTKDTLPQHSVAPPVVQAQAPPSISLINAAAFIHATKLEGSQSFCLQLNLSDFVSACSSSLVEEKIDLSNVLSYYHEFANIFSNLRYAYHLVCIAEGNE